LTKVRGKEGRGKGEQRLRKHVEWDYGTKRQSKREGRGEGGLKKK